VTRNIVRFAGTGEVVSALLTPRRKVDLLPAETASDSCPIRCIHGAEPWLGMLQHASPKK